MRKRLLAGLMIALCILGLYTVCAGDTAYADDQETVDNTARFSGTVQLLKEDEDTCVLQVEVENVGEDFEGTVRLMMMATDGNGSCAYDTSLTLPQQGKKQFTLTIPTEVFGQNDRSRGSGSLSFLDESEKTLAQIPFTNLFGSGSQSAEIGVGILSDSYDKLSYLDMDGQGLDLGEDSLPVNLVELSPDQVADALDGLYFLVIDQFDTSTLSPETITAIEDWTRDGGWLILGTGESVSGTLDAFDKDFLQMAYGSVSKPGSSNAAYVLAESSTGYYYEYTSSGIDFKNMAVAELTSTGVNDYETSNFPGWCGSRDEGSVAVLSLSLCEDEMQKASPVVVNVLYSEVMTASSSFFSYSGDDSYSYYVQRCFGEIDHANTTVDFTWLKVLIVVYVVLVGPILYLLLARMKKREWYWVAVPAFGILFIGMVFVFGQNLRLNTTKLYSVAVQNADGRDESTVDTYFCGYHSGTRPWSVQLTDGYAYAGPAFTTFANYSGTISSASDYHYRIGVGDALTIGMNPGSNFENAYLYASGKGAGVGTIGTQDLILDMTTLSGTVTNNTEYDFSYLMLAAENSVLVLPELKAGQTVDIADAIAGGDVVFQYNTEFWDDVYYSLVGDYYGSSGTEIDEELAAVLYTGVTSIKQRVTDSGSIIVAGAVRDYDRATTGNCAEISYGCFYTVAEQEVSDAAD